MKYSIHRSNVRTIEARFQMEMNYFIHRANRTTIEARFQMEMNYLIYRTNYVKRLISGANIPNTPRRQTIYFTI